MESKTAPTTTGDDDEQSFFLILILILIPILIIPSMIVGGGRVINIKIIIIGITFISLDLTRLAKSYVS